MTNDTKRIDFEDQVADDIYHLLLSMNEEEMKEFLAESGLDSSEIAKSHQHAIEVAVAGCGKALLEEARSQLNAATVAGRSGNIVSLSLDRKRQIRDVLLARATDERMTMAARNQSSEEDIDALIEASIILGILDERGDLK